MLLIAMLTYAVMAALIFTGLMSLPVTRYVSDKLYTGENGKVIPSLYGSLCILLPVGAVCYLIFLLQSPLTVAEIILNEVLFLLLASVFMMSGYLSAIRDYKGIMVSYLVAMAAAFVSVVVLNVLCGNGLWTFLLGTCIGYGCQLVYSFMLLYDFFESDRTGAFDFMPYMRRHFSLSLIGTLNNLAVFSHIVMAWHSKIALPIKGAFYTSPYYDVPAFYAYLATLVTTIFFVSRAETNFFTKYSSYFAALNAKAPYYFVKEKREQMLTVMWADILQAAVLQILTTIGMLSFGTIIFDQVGLGEQVQIRSYFIELTVGYGIYATANMLTLFSMYFADYRSVLIDTGIYAACVLVFTYVFMAFGPLRLYGMGFCIASLVFLIASYVNLRTYTSNLEYQVLAKHPFVS